MSQTPETAAERQQQVARGLAAFLSEQWGGQVAIENMVVTSAGARRGNVLFDAVRSDGTRVPLCVTYLPTLNIELMKITDEARLIQLAEAAGVPVPHVHFASEDASWLGGPFFISDRVDGETVPRRVLRQIAADGTGERVAEQLGQAFGSLHQVREQDAPASLDRPPGNPAEIALERLREQVDGLLQPGPVFELGLRWLSRNPPRAPERLTVVHGDIRNGNIIVDHDGLAAVLDWEVAKIGDPMEDLAWPCLRCWRFGEDRAEVGGFGSREAFVRGYQDAGGDFDADSFHWWKVLGTMRWGLGLAGQAKAHLDGSFSNIVMAASGRRVAEQEYDLLCLLRPRG